MNERATFLLTLIHREWIEVRRLAPWTSPTGQRGCQPRELVPRDQLAVMLHDPAAWAYPEDGDWIGYVTLAETKAGKAITRLLPGETSE
ncbi:hypothetical protein [Streptomyces sp. NPDC058701]|uniref:hypothetical protein n=1 Tax=Streptomyces sp. NPDC058701 TaxID=3346608 RepID=UPI00364B96A1